MDKELSLVERVLQSLREPSGPRVPPKGQQRAPKPESEPVREGLHPGVWVEFLSPVWGLCSAQVQAVTLQGCVLTNHSVLRGEDEPVVVPVSWIRGVHTERQT